MVFPLYALLLFQVQNTLNHVIESQSKKALSIQYIHPHTAWQDMITLDEDEENDMYIIDSDSEHYQTPEEDDADYDEWMDLEDEEQLGSPPVPKNNGHPQPTYQRALSPIISVTSPGGKSKSNSVTPDGKFPNAISHGIVSDEIFQQLQCFGYDSRSDIQQAMEDAVNPENINEIIDRLKENENHS